MEMDLLRIPITMISLLENWPYIQFVVQLIVQLIVGIFIQSGQSCLDVCLKNDLKIKLMKKK